MRFSRSKGYSIGCESEKIPKIRFSRCYLIHDYLSSIIGKYLAHVLSTSSKNKKVLIFSYISEMEHSGSNIKKTLIFCYTSGNGDPPFRV